MDKHANKDGLESRGRTQASTGPVREIDGHSHARSHTDAPRLRRRRDRQPNGRFARGTEVGKATRFRRLNQHAVKHGLRIRLDPEGSAGASELTGQDLVPQAYRFLRAELRTFVEDCIADEGGDIAAIPPRRRALLELRARIQRRAVQLDTALELRGLIDRRGKLRANWLQRLEGLMSTAKALDSLLGLERRPEQIPTVDEFLSQVDRSEGRRNGDRS